MGTKYFSNSIAVFQGGGAKAAAYAGVVKASHEMGVEYVGLIGASAGSVVAALIAAGMSPENIAEKSKIALRDLVSPLEDIKKSKLLSLSKFICSGLHDIFCAYLYKGVYSSKAIEEWMSKCLNEELSMKGEDVLFRHLKSPLAIIAADIKNSTYKIWSSLKTPNASVAYAVRCSCSIPFFFQPVEGESYYLDGGIVSNLPVFLRDEFDVDDGVPVLCFSLVNAGFARSFDNGFDVMLGVVDSAMSSNVDIQHLVSRNAYKIRIDTGNVSSTQMHISEDEYHALYDSGYNSVIKFINNEKVYLAEFGFIGSKLEIDRDLLLIKTLKLIGEAQESVRVMAGDLSWIDEVYPALVLASYNNVKITFLCNEDMISKDSPAVLSALSIGSNVIFSNIKINVAGTLVDVERDYGKMILVDSKPSMHGRLFYKRTDSALIDHMLTFFSLSVAASSNLDSHRHILLDKIDDENFLNVLNSNVDQYIGKKITFENIDPKRTKPLTRHLEEFKLARSDILDQIIDVHHGYCAMARGTNFFITPPVVEKISSNEYVVIDGTHRFYNALAKGVKLIRAICVHDCDAKLPAVPTEWDKVRVGKRGMPREQRYYRYDDSAFREISHAFRHLLDG